jgi:hypothetical protein
MEVKNYANGDSKQGRQLLYFILVGGGVLTILKYFLSDRKKARLEITKLNMEIEKMEQQNKTQHPNG